MTIEPVRVAFRRILCYSVNAAPLLSFSWEGGDPHGDGVYIRSVRRSRYSGLLYLQVA